MEKVMDKTRTAKELDGVHPILQDIVWEAWSNCKQAFVCTDGLRTLAEQKVLVDKGASKTMKSKHLEGKAVDLTPFEGRKPRWEMPLCFVVADAMKAAAIKLKTPIRWGGAWHCPDITKSSNSAAELHKEYIAICKLQKKTPFIDGPHFELV